MMSTTPSLDIIYISDDEIDTLPKTAKVQKDPLSYSGSVLFKATRNGYGDKALNFRRTLFEFLDFVKKSEPQLSAVLTTNSYITRKAGFSCVCDICRNDDEEEDYYLMYPVIDRKPSGQFSLCDEKLQNSVEVCGLCYRQWIYQVKEEDRYLDMFYHAGPYRHLVKTSTERTGTGKFSYVIVKHVNLYMAMNEEQ